MNGRAVQEREALRECGPGEFTEPGVYVSSVRVEKQSCWKGAMAKYGGSLRVRVEQNVVQRKVLLCQKLFDGRK